MGSVKVFSQLPPDGEPPRSLPRLPLWLQYAVLSVITLVLFVPGQSHGLMLYDLGELSFFVQALVDGKVPGLDFIVNGYGPARYVLLAWLLPFFDSELAAMHGFFLVIRLGGVAALFALSRRLLPMPWSLLPVGAFLIAPGPLHKGLFVLGSVVMVLGFLRYLERPGRVRALQMGALVAVAGSFRLDLGAFGLLLILGLCLSARSRRRDLRSALLPAIVAVGVCLLWLSSQGTGAVSAVLEQAFGDALANQGVDHPVFPGLAQLLSLKSLDPWLLYLPFLAYGALLLRLTLYLPVTVSGQQESDPLARQGRWIVLVFGVLCCNQVQMKPELGHLLQAGPLLYLAVTLVLADVALGRPGGTPGLSPASLARRKRRSAVLFGLALLVPAALMTSVLGEHRGSLYTGSFTIAWDRDQSLETEIGRAWLSAPEHAEMAPLLAWIRDKGPPGPLWVPTHQPLLYALTGRADVSGFSSLVYYAGSDELQDLLLSRLEKNRPAVVVFVDNSIEGPRLFIENAAPEVLEWMRRNYVERARFGANVVMVEKP